MKILFLKSPILKFGGYFFPKNGILVYETHQKLTTS